MATSQKLFRARSATSRITSGAPSVVPTLPARSRASSMSPVSAIEVINGW
jgi:hypothetical protein